MKSAGYGRVPAQQKRGILPRLSIPLIIRLHTCLGDYDFPYIPSCRKTPENLHNGSNLPQSIQKDFSASTVQYFWANSAFLLLTVLTQPLVTSLSNIFGRIYLLYSCLLLFAAGAALVGAAPSIYVLIVGRVVQGIGGGGVDVLTEIIVTDITSLKERAFYVGLLNIPTALGSVLGPVVGGAFSTYVSWRWVAWIDLVCSSP